MAAPTVLLIDDDMHFREAVAMRLERTRYRTLQAGDGATGLEAVRRHRPDLVLLDLMMHGADGIDFLRALRADETIRGTTVVAVTAASDRRLLAAAADLGIAGCLFKTTFTLDELSSFVAALAAPAAA